MLVNPRLGRRRCSGICPPSKPRIRRDPERDPWPLWPRVDVLPIPLPIPRPIRLRFAVAPFGGLNVERLVGTCFLFGAARLAAGYSVSLSIISLLSDDLHQVGNFRDHPANRGSIFPLHNLVQPGKAQPFDHQLVLFRCADFRAHILNANCLFCRRHNYSSCDALPRMAATSCRSRSFLSASKVALITLWGLAVPIDLVSTFCTPAEVMTARTAPPAITPVPSGAGLSSTIPDPKRPSTVCGMELCVRLTRTRFFLADSIPLRMACGTSLAFPEP